MTNTSTFSKTDRKIDALLLEADISYVATIFDSVDEAKRAYKKLINAQDMGIVRIIDTAYVEKTERSRLKVHDHREWAFGEGVLMGDVGGVVAGGLIGIIAGAILLPAVIGGLIGGAIMSVYERKVKFPYQDLKEIANTLPVGTSALIAIVEDEYLEAVEEEVQRLGGKKVHSNKIPKSTFDSLSSVKLGD